MIGTAEILLPYGELKLIAPSVVEAAKRAKVPVAVHYDHGLTFERCMEALKLGFSSVMYDGSAKKRETNIAETREIVKIAHSFGAVSYTHLEAASRAVCDGSAAGAKAEAFGDAVLSAL